MSTNTQYRYVAARSYHHLCVRVVKDRLNRSGVDAGVLHCGGRNGRKALPELWVVRRDTRARDASFSEMSIVDEGLKCGVQCGEEEEEERDYHTQIYFVLWLEEVGGIQPRMQVL